MRHELLSREPKANAHSTPILFVHGLWIGVWCWDEHFMDYFAAHGYACYALSLRGHGNSEGKERLRWIRLSEYVDDIAQVITHLPTAPILVGHSNGGAVVQKYLESHSAPAGVLMASVPAGGALQTTLNTMLKLPLPFLKSNLTMSLYPLVGTPQRARRVFFSPTTPEEIPAKYFPRLTDESFLEFLDILLFNRPNAKKVKTPMLVLGAEHDFLFPPNQVNATARAYNTQATIFPNMGHGMMLEPGWQAVADKIIAWLGERGL